ncbi:hypothetical protein K501DRAFT_269443 [Backusella circina FSU 941]|nr:hypothetical protein K501DRAFT_269439 [Backusella circina FSU 941]KAI8886865.1 hypothetical protein K501DRAFT_269443 [Backusella circina FSU 941]
MAQTLIYSFGEWYLTRCSYRFPMSVRTLNQHWNKGYLRIWQEVNTSAVYDAFLSQFPERDAAAKDNNSLNLDGLLSNITFYIFRFTSNGSFSAPNHGIISTLMMRALDNVLYSVE